MMTDFIGDCGLSWPIAQCRLGGHMTSGGGALDCARKTRFDPVAGKHESIDRGRDAGPARLPGRQRERRALLANDRAALQHGGACAGNRPPPPPPPARHPPPLSPRSSDSRAYHGTAATTWAIGSGSPRNSTPAIRPASSRTRARAFRRTAPPRASTYRLAGRAYISCRGFRGSTSEASERDGPNISARTLTNGAAAASPVGWFRAATASRPPAPSPTPPRRPRRASQASA